MFHHWWSCLVRRLLCLDGAIFAADEEHRGLKARLRVFSFITLEGLYSVKAWCRRIGTRLFDGRVWGVEACREGTFS